MKKIVLIVISALIIFGLCGCSKYPLVHVDTGPFDANREITMGSPYKYDGFDIESTEEGNDVILHFIKEAR